MVPLITEFFGPPGVQLEHGSTRIHDILYSHSIPSPGPAAGTQLPPEGLSVVLVVTGAVDCNFVVMFVLGADTAHGASWVVIASVAGWTGISLCGCFPKMGTFSLKVSCLSTLAIAVPCRPFLVGSARSGSVGLLGLRVVLHTWSVLMGSKWLVGRILAGSVVATHYSRVFPDSLALDHPQFVLQGLVHAVRHI